MNHNGNMDLAKSMIDAAVDAGVDAVKFQTFKADKLILKNVKKAPYQKVTTDSAETQYDMLKKLDYGAYELLQEKKYSVSFNTV